MKKCTGTFKVDLKPLEFSTPGKDDLQLGRMQIDKTFSGGLKASSKGEMLNAMTTTKGSAGYVAIEQVSGSLDGKEGSFALQHYGVMHAGTSKLILEVIPNSGAGELSGITGSMTIDQSTGEHVYEMEYTLDQ
jgi:hypothetical protein